MEKKHRKWKPKSFKDKNRDNNAFIKSAVCDSKKLKFYKEQKATGLLSSLGRKAPLRKIPLVGACFFKRC